MNRASPAPRGALRRSLMVDVDGLALTSAERELLAHPAVAGAVLFARNFVDERQLEALVRDIRGVCEPSLLVAVDHEGGRVQRFGAPFTPMPAAGEFGRAYRADPTRGLELCEAAAWLAGSELRSVGIDINFAPVVDLDGGNAAIIGSRAYDADAVVVATLAEAYLRGLRRAGVFGVAKHFPGHGGAEGDTHTDRVSDPRPLAAMWGRELAVYRHLIARGLDAVMPAHVRFPDVDDRPAGFSPVWLGDVLRRRLGFSGVVLSDDLSMVGAADDGPLAERVASALGAGCDCALVLNDREGACALLDTSAAPDPRGPATARLDRLRTPGASTPLAELHRSAAVRSTVRALAGLSAPPDRP